MTNFIPIFPLGLVAYPGEQLNLHIFEPRYKQLIEECVEQKKMFGIPVVINNRLEEMGILVQVLELSKKYPTGEMDIKTMGIKIFRMLEVITHLPDKLYSGAIVSYPDNLYNGRASMMAGILARIREMHIALSIEKIFGKPDEALTSYDVAHYLGLALEQEYELLCIFTELQRQEYLKRYLNNTENKPADDRLIERVKLNGHFRHIQGFEI